MNSIYEDEIFIHENQRKKGFLYHFINVILYILIAIFVYLLGKNLVVYYELYNQTQKDNNVENRDYTNLTCDVTTNVVRENNTPGSLEDVSFEANQEIGYIEIPALDMYRTLLKGDQNDSQIAAMERGVAYDPNTRLPGLGANTVIAGHREFMFAPLENIKEGDGIIVNIAGQTYLYEVTSTKIITPDQPEEVFLQTDKDSLVLYTCFPFVFYSNPNERFVVYADPVEQIDYESECPS